MNVFLYNDKNKKVNWDELFSKELKKFAADYNLTLEEATGILANAAALNVKKAVLHESESIQ